MVRLSEGPGTIVGMRLTWPGVVVVGMVLTALVVLLVTGHSGTELLSLLGVLIAAGLLGQQSVIKENTNGNHSRALGIIQRQSDQLARSQPITVDDTSIVDTYTAESVAQQGIPPQGPHGTDR